MVEILEHPLYELERICLIFTMHLRIIDMLVIITKGIV